MMEEASTGPRPTAEEVIARLKDDGDFDTLRLKIISKVKENEELRNRIITEVKQSQILNQDDSENLKPRQLSDAIYQELGKKIMGQISDEVWKVIRGGDTKDDIRGTVESVYDRIVNPKPKEEDHRSSPPAKDNPGKQEGVSLTPAPAEEANMCEEMPPGFAPSNNQANKAEHNEEHNDQLPNLPEEEELHNFTDIVDDDNGMPPGFAIPVSSAGAGKVSPSNVMNSLRGAGAGAAMPQGLETGCVVDVAMPPGFSTNGVGAGSFGALPTGFGGAGVAAADDEDDDPDVPPGFG